MIGRFVPSLGGSEYLKFFYNLTRGEIPSVDLQSELNLQNAVLSLNEKKLLSSAKDLSLGGFLVALCKTAFGKQVGIKLNNFNFINLRNDIAMFGESSCSVIISYEKHLQEQIQEIVKSYALQFFEIGESISDYSLQIESLNLKISMDKLQKNFEEGLVKYFE
ncbi:MAG: AIR synthase-related protein [Candidatus Omnitrophica bacterium]|nr:AIR synthase-related protein [Candidatus Omnitrophota bacterium]